MQFASGKFSEAVTSRDLLIQLVDKGLRQKAAFFVGHDNRNCLRVAMYSDEGILLELHRGKTREAWVSPPVAEEQQVRSMFTEYYEQGDLPENLLTGNAEWVEVAAFPTSVHMIIGVVTICLIIYFGFIA